MKEIQIKTLFRQWKTYAEEEVIVKGWIRTNRNSNKFGFIELNDGSFFHSIQIVYEQEKLQNFEEIAKAPIAAALLVKGSFVLTPQARQPFEIKATEVIIKATSQVDYPLQKKHHSMEFLREIAHLRPRSNTFNAVFRVRSMVAFALHKFFQEQNFIYLHTPIITGSDAEGAGELFRVSTLEPANPPRTPEGTVDFDQDFFAKETSLTVSGQLEAEAFAMAFQKVYTFGPAFRAENSNTARHASEFWMIEPEVAFANLEDIMDLAETNIKYLSKYTLRNAPEEMDFFNRFADEGLLDRLVALSSTPFERVTYTEAIRLLEQSGKIFQYPVKWGRDLQTEHERYLTEEIYNKPVFVTDYPKDIKAFYMRRNDDGKTVAACDLLVPGVGEIIGGSQREERYDLLKERMDEMHMSEEDYGWYLDLRKYGGVMHSGYGLGFERILLYLTGMTNIRDVIPFPRTPNSADF